MKKRRISAAMRAVMVAGSLADYGLKTLDAPTTTAATATKAAITAAENKDANATIEATADTSDMPEITLIMTEANPLDTIADQADSKFKETVEELPSGKIKVDLQTSGVLGSENDVLDTMLNGGGTIDISRTSAFALTSYGAEKSVLTSVSYAFVNRNHFWNFAGSDLAPELLMEPHDNGLGVRGLFYGEEGFRHFFTVKEVSGLENLEGVKLRVSNGPAMNGMVDGLGVSPTAVSFNELCSALQTGVVDGAKQPIVNYKPNAFQEVAPNLILDGHTSGAIQVIVTDEIRDKLTEAQQNISMEAGKVVSEFNRTISEEAENKVLDELKIDGINVVEVPDIKPWQDACKDVIESSTKDQAELHQQLLDMNK